jgi:hypothetical protein
MVTDAAWPPIRNELRWLNAALGIARDQDVTANYARRKRYRRWAKDLGTESHGCGKRPIAPFPTS